MDEVTGYSGAEATMSPGMRARRFVIGVMVTLLALGGFSQVFGQTPQAHAQGGELAAGIMKGAAEAGAEIGVETAQFAADNIDKVCLGQEDVINCTVALVQMGSDMDQCYKDAEEETGGPEGEDGASNMLSSFTDCLGEKGFGQKPEEEESAEDEQTDRSFARISTVLAEFYNGSLSAFGDDLSGKDKNKANKEEEGDDAEGADSRTPSLTGGDEEDKPTGLQAWKSVMGSGGAGGSFVGYLDATKGDNQGGLYQPSTGGVAGFDYSALAPLSANDEDGEENKGGSARPDTGVTEYVYYGAALSGMGLDSTSSRGVVESPLGTIQGGAILMAYTFSGFIDALFEGVISILRFLNPFSLLVDSVSENTNPTFTQGMGGEEDPDGVFDSLKEFIGTVYNGVVGIGWMVTIPIFIAVVAIGAVMAKRYDTGKGIKQLVIRLTFLVVGLPLLGVSYTGALDSIGGGPQASTSSNATKVVLSTYVDFNSWAMNSRMALYDDEKMLVEWDPVKQGPSDEAMANLRSTALAINTGSYNPAFSGLGEDLGSELANGGNVGWFQDMEGEDVVEKKVNEGDKGAADAFIQTMQMLTRYVSGEQISSADYASAASTAMGDMSRAKPEAASTIQGWMDQLTDAKQLASMDEEAVTDMKNPLISVRDNSVRDNSVGDKSGLITEVRDGGIVSFKDAGDGLNSMQCTAGLVTSTMWDPSDPESDPRSACNLAPMAMFNYLNTEFGSSSGTVFSTTGGTTQYSRQSHNSVNAIGTGVMGFIYWFSAISLLGSFVLIGLFYAMGMLISSIKRGIQLLGSVPFAAMGLMGAITKVIAYTVVLFLEILGTLFIYKLFQEFLMVFPGLVERFLMKPFEGTDGALAGGGALVGSLLGFGSPVTGVIVITLLASSGVILFTLMAVKFRSSMIGALDEAVTNLVNKLTDSSVSSASSDGPGSLRQGVARGAGMAAAHGILSGGPGSGGEMASAADGVDDSALGGGGAMAGAGALAGAGAGGVEVDGDGQLLDADGSTIEGPDGSPMTVDDAIDLDAEGNVLDADGTPVLDADGQPIKADDIGAIDANGQLYGHSGDPLVSADGSGVYGSTAAGAAGAAGVTAGGSPMNDSQLAASVMERGSLSEPGEMTHAADTGGAVPMSAGPSGEGEGMNTMAGAAATAATAGAVKGMSSMGVDSTQASQAVGNVAAAGKTLGASGLTGVSGGGSPAAPAAPAAPQAPMAPQSPVVQSGAPGGPGVSPQAAANVPPHTINTSVPVVGNHTPVASHAPMSGAPGAPGGPGVVGIVGSSVVGGAVSNAIAGNRRGRGVNESINGGRKGGAKGGGQQSGQPGGAAGRTMGAAAVRGLGGVGMVNQAHLFGGMNGSRPGGGPQGPIPPVERE